MESSSKLNIPRTQLEKIVEHAFGGTRTLISAEENRDGWFNALYSLTFSDGTEVFLKAAPPEDVSCLRYEKDIIKTETAVLRLFAEQKGIPAPKILFEDGRRQIIESHYFIMEKLEGSSYFTLRDTLDSKKRERLEEEKGRINRAINRIGGDSFGLFSPDRPKYSTWKKAFLQMIEDILTDAEDFGASFPISAERIGEEIRKRADCLDSVTDPVLVHWDLHDGNILVGKEGKISGIIDCDRALWGDRAIEFYHSARFPSGDAFYRGYGEDLKKQENFVQRRELYDLYLALIFVTECRSREISDQNHLDWAWKVLTDQLAMMKIST